MRFLFNSLDNHNIDRITEKYTITRDTSFILGNLHGGKNPSKNFLNIDSQYNAKRINQTIQKVLCQVCASLSLPSSPTAAPNLHSNEQVSE
jgi:hypothetical protein